jgi:hypothetical protein
MNCSRPRADKPLLIIGIKRAMSSGHKAQQIELPHALRRPGNFDYRAPGGQFVMAGKLMQIQSLDGEMPGVEINPS